jgi:enoyl-CoA hydratase/carnithine racemase
VTQGLRLETKESTRWLRLERPPRNLLDPAVMDALADELRRCDADESITAVVLTGSGDTFCGGLDVAAIEAGGDPVVFASALIALLRLLPTLGKPVLAAVNGDALASGFALVCAADYAVTVPDAKLGTLEASVGLWPMTAQVPLLHRLLPRHALQTILSGVPFDSEDALRIGAVNSVVDSAELEPAVLDFANLAARAGTALAPGRRSFYRLLDLSYDEALVQALDEFAALFEDRRTSPSGQLAEE